MGDEYYDMMEALFNPLTSRTVPVTECRKVPDEECVTREEEVCEEVPRTRCGDIHRRVPHTLRRRKPVQVCGGQRGEELVIET